MRRERHALCRERAQLIPRKHTPVGRRLSETRDKLVDERHPGIVRKPLDVIAEVPVSVPARSPLAEPEVAGFGDQRPARARDRGVEPIPPEDGAGTSRKRSGNEQRHRDSVPAEYGP